MNGLLDILVILVIVLLTVCQSFQFQRVLGHVIQSTLWQPIKTYSRCLAMSEFTIVIPKSPTIKPKLAVTILSGFLGSGKTTLLQHILTNNNNNKKYAIIVNDMSELNIDGMLVKPFVQHQQEELIEMSNGCICCTLREDLLKEIVKLGKESKYDHLIIESTGISEPMAVAETFTFEIERQLTSESDERLMESLMDIAEIDSMVTVVDAKNFLHDMKNVEDLKDRNLQVNENDTRTVTDLLVSQVEFASVVLLNKCDMLKSREEIDEVKTWIRSLNSDTKIIETIRSNVDINEIIGSRSYDYDKVSQSPAWLQTMNIPENERREKNKRSESEEYGISSFIYRARKPFHPSRLMKFINEAFPVKSFDVIEQIDNNSSNNNNHSLDPISNRIDVGSSNILRSKGFFWLASDPEHMYIWSQAGGLFQLSQGGNWWIDTPQDKWPTDEEDIMNVQADYEGTLGDRRQELVFIGTAMENDKIISTLDGCLLSDIEMIGGSVLWKTFENPFPDASLPEMKE